MLRWTLVDGLLSDGLPMRMWIAERDGAGRDSKVWRSALHDDEHPCTEDEFAWKCGFSGGNDAGKPLADARGSETRGHACRQLQNPDREGGGIELQQAAREVQEYFAGERLTFEIPLDLQGTPFQVRVWRELTRIPFGSARSYGEIAEAIGLAKAPRAVGGANGRNRLPIFVPCHRVIASGGKLGGYTGGISLKKRLLAHEAAVLGRRAAA